MSEGGESLLSECEGLILTSLDQNGGNLTRSKLLDLIRSRFGDQTDTYYWRAEQNLVDSLKIERRRGRTGGIYRVTSEMLGVSDVGIDVANQAAAAGYAEYERELDFYEPVRKTISENWASSDRTGGFKRVFVCVTAHQGSRSTGGRWSRPDIILCTVSDYVFSSRPEGDVRTIELKRFGDLDVLAVYEALSHRSKAHYSYLLVVEWPEVEKPYQDRIDQILAVAEKHGVGVITVRNPEDWSTWSHVVSPTRSDTDNQSINMMVLDQVPKEIRDEFQSELRTVSVNLQGSVMI